MKLRLKQFLAITGRFTSGDEILDAINRGKIGINNKTFTNPNYFLNPKMDKVTYNNEIVRKQKKLYYLMYKPAGYLSSKLTNQERALGKKSAFELFNTLKLSEAETKSLFLVGRLDEDTEGLIIATNDGELSSRITSPESRIEKEYECVLQKALSEKDAERIKKGVAITLEENGKAISYTTKPAKLKHHANKASIIIIEGKKREIRRIFEALGNKVLSLKRVRIGKLTLGKLKPKEMQNIAKENIY